MHENYIPEELQDRECEGCHNTFDQEDGDIRQCLNCDAWVCMDCAEQHACEKKP